MSVIIGAYNAMPYLTRCLESVVSQTIGADRMEVVAVDDGSTDGTGAELDRVAAAHPGLFRVIHQENSGGPAGPRNTGLDLVRGRYVFFLDADDHLGGEALARMVAMADAHGSDVVLGRMEGVGGRRAPTLAYKEHRARATVFDSRVYWNLTVLKLFRRELVERLGLRFPPELRIRQDQPFCAMAYLHAANISVINDYTCVYWVNRDDGDNISRRVRGTEYRVRALRVMFELLAREVPAGPRRDQLLYRHLATELRAALRHLREEDLTPSDRQRLFDELKELLTTWHSEGAAGRLPAIRRLAYELVRHGTMEQLFAAWSYTLDRIKANGDGQLNPGQSLLPAEVLIEGDRAYACYPYFRDPRTPLPDATFDMTREIRGHHHLESVVVEDDGVVRITGRAGLPRVLHGTLDVVAVLRERNGEREYTTAASVRRAPDATPESTGFTVDVDPYRADDGRPLPAGVWDLWLELRVDAFRHRVRVGHDRAESVPDGPVVGLPAGRDVAGGRPYTLYYTAPYGNLSLDTGDRKHRPLDDLRVEAVEWAADGPPNLHVRGTLRYRYPADALHLTARAGAGSGRIRRVPVTYATDSGTFRAELALPPGAADWSLELGCGPDLRRPVSTPQPPATAKWFRAGWPWYARPSVVDGGLTIRVGRLRPVRAVLGRLRRVAARLRRTTAGRTRGRGA